MTQAQQRTYMCNYIKNMGSHTLKHLKKLSFDEVKKLFETTMKRVNIFTQMKSDDTVPKVIVGSSKRDTEQELNHGCSKRQKIGEGSEPAKESKDKFSQEQLQQLMIIVPEEGMNVEALQTKYPIIDWEVELKRLFKPDDDDTLWKLQRESFKDFDNGLHNEINEVKMVFNQMEATIEHCSVDKKCFEIQKKELLLENNRLLELLSVTSQGILDKQVESTHYNIKRKNVSDNNEPVKNASVIAPGMFKLDLEPLSQRLKNNREAHEDYLQISKEHTITLRDLVERARKYSKVDRHKLVTITLMNKTRKSRSQETKATSSTTQKQPASQTKQTTNNPLLSSRRVVPSTSASRSQSNNNTRKDRIMPATSSNKKNKTIEVYPRKVMSSSTKMNCVSLCNAIFKHAVKDVNSKFVCSTCNGCLFSANHDQCVVTYINDVNKRVKYKSNKSKKMEWKPTGKVFTSVRHRWLPTGRTFTIIGTQCPQTKITANPIVPPKETSPTPVLTPSPEVKGSAVSNSPSSSRVHCMSSKLSCGTWTQDAGSA
ncbi:hypothetical protein Tco_1561833 [Tanacetum coccineum]